MGGEFEFLKKPGGTINSDLDEQVNDLESGLEEASNAFLNARVDAMDAKYSANGGDGGDDDKDKKGEKKKEEEKEQKAEKKTENTKSSWVKSTQQHEAGADYKDGKIRDKGTTNLKSNDKKTNLTNDKNQQLFFKKDDGLTLLESDGLWIKVKGTAHYLDGKIEMNAVKTEGWIKRTSTDMTLGLFKGIETEDRTEKDDLGAIGRDVPLKEVKGIIVHQTGGTDAKSAFNEYKRKINKKEHVAAQYMIDEHGKVTLVVPINESVYHAPSDRMHKHGTHPPELEIHPKDLGEKSMKAVRDKLKYMYAEGTRFLPGYVYEFLTKKSDAQLYDYLKENNWSVYPVELSNSNSIGIEVVGMYKTIYERKPLSSGLAYSKTQMTGIVEKINALVSDKKISEDDRRKALNLEERDKIEKSKDEKLYPDQKAKDEALSIFDETVFNTLKGKNWLIANSHHIFSTDNSPGEVFGDVDCKELESFIAKMKALNLSPDMKEQLLQSAERKRIEDELATSKLDEKKVAALKAELNGLNKSLFQLMESLEFNIYEDSSGEQKYSTWMLVNKLAKHFSLDLKKDFNAHYETERKTLGEGQGNMEFIRKMVDFKQKYQQLVGLKNPKANVELSYFISIFKALDEEVNLKNKAVTKFFDDFYSHYNELLDIHKKHIK